MNDFLSTSGKPTDSEFPNLSQDQLHQLVGEIVDREGASSGHDGSGPDGSDRNGSVVPLTRRRNLKRGAGVLVALMTAAVLAIIGMYANLADKAADGLSDSSVSLNLAPPSQTTASVDSSTGEATPTAPAEVAVPAAAGGPMLAENILLVGSDSRTGANNIDGSEAEAATADGSDTDTVTANTDTVMVVHLSADRKQTSVLSLPRDLWVDVVPCQAWDPATDSYGDQVAGDLSQMHLNAFYGVGGPQCLVDAVEQLTQLHITRYIQIDFAGFAAMVDALGGVTVNACGPIIDAQLGTIIAAGGEQTITGAQALSVARARKVEGDAGSDLSRIHRQQLLLSALLRQLKSAGVLLDPGALSDFIQAFTANTTTSGLDFQSLIGLAESLGDPDPSRVVFYTLPTVPDSEADARGSLVVDEALAPPLLEGLRTDSEVRAAPASSGPLPTSGLPSQASGTIGSAASGSTSIASVTASTTDCM